VTGSVLAGAARYRVFDFTIEADVSLPELSVTGTTSSDRDMALRAHPPRRQDRTAAWFQHWRLPDGTVWAFAGRVERSLLLRFPGLADFAIADHGTSVDAWPVAGVPEVTLRHLFLDQVLPLVVSHRGELVLHASAVRLPGGAVGFLGRAGAGKSTLAASFWAHGLPLVADDALMVRREGATAVGLAAYAGLRLWPDVLGLVAARDRGAAAEIAHYTGKRRLGPAGRASRFSPGPLPLVRLYALAPPGRARGGVRIAALTSREALMTLVRHAYRLDTADAVRLAAEFERLSDMTSRVPCRVLAYPRTLAGLDEVRRAILEDLAHAEPEP
jgi:hypothetical protein